MHEATQKIISASAIAYMDSPYMATLRARGVNLSRNNVVN